MDTVRTANFFLLIIAMLALGAILKLAQSVFIPLLIALLLSYVMDPLMLVLRRALPVWLATAITALVFLGVLTGFGILAWVNIAALGRGLPLYQDELLQLARGVDAWLQATVGAPLEIEFTALAELGAVSIPSFMLSTARSTVTVVLAFLMVYLFAVLFLAGKHYFPRKLVRAFPRTAAGVQSPVLVILKHIDDSLRRFIAVKTVISLAVGGLTSVVAALFGVAFPVAWGLLTFVLNFIPYVGSVTAVVAFSVFALAQFGAWAPALGVFLCALALQTLTGTVAEPALIGDILNLSLLVVFVSILFWGWLWGPAGILLAVPMTAAVKVILENIPVTARLAPLLEGVRGTTRQR